MGFIHHEVSREFIAQPDSAKGQIVFKWPDINIRRGARAIVDADQSAVFLAKGEVAGLLGPGQHQLEATEIPFLGILIDHASDGNAYRTEIYFVGTREYTGDGFTFGGPSRLAFHGVDRVYPATSTLLAEGGRFNLTLRRVTPP